MPELQTQLGGPFTKSLKQVLVDRILREGPITFHDWMQAALYSPSIGYYMRTDLQRWGREGDYRTSPERSELFAFTFARYFNELYEKLGQPKPFTILECGAGDGTFAHGVLSYLRKRLPHVFEVTKYLVDEVSDDSRVRLQNCLRSFADHVEIVSLSGGLSIDTTVVFSNELFDAFPVHRLQVVDGRLREFYVSIDADRGFAWTIGELSQPWLAHFVEASEIRLTEGQIIEVCPGIERWYSNLARRVKRGFVVTVDYGREASDLYDFNERPEGTLRAYSKHQFVSVLDRPGDFDITTSIDWGYLKRCGLENGFAVTEFDRMDQFLIKVGLLDELTATLEGLTTDSEKLRLTTAAREMILPGAMASSFQVLVQRLN